MIKIKATDLEIIQQERVQEVKAPADTAKALSNLAISNAKKDIVIGQLAQTISKLSIQIKKLGGTF